MAVNTGTGATLTLGGSAFVANIVSITGVEITRESIDTTNLGVSGDYMTSIPADLLELGELEVTFNWDDTAGGPDPTGAAASAVLTWPQGANTTAANLTGTAFVTSVKYPDFEVNGLQVGVAKLKYDGATGPTYTAAT